MRYKVYFLSDYIMHDQMWMLLWDKMTNEKKKKKDLNKIIKKKKERISCYRKIEYIAFLVGKIKI